MRSSIGVQNHGTPDPRSLSTLLREHQLFGSLKCYVKAGRLVQLGNTVSYQIIDGFVAVVIVVVKLVVKRASPIERLQ